MSRKQDKPLKKELESYQEAGVACGLTGGRVIDIRIVKAHRIAEDGVYMRDYVEDEKGEIKGIKFDFIKKEIK